MTSDAAAAPEPVLLEGQRFEGLVVLPRHARIDGEVRGTVLAGGTVWVGPTGLVEADLDAEAVVVEGRVHGHLRATHSIALGNAASVRGDLCAPKLAIEEGARVDGRCECGAPEAMAERGAPAAGSAPATP